MTKTLSARKSKDREHPGSQSSTSRMHVQHGRAERGPRLHIGHFAFMRAVVQGLDTRQSWDRYLRLEGEHDDMRNVRRTIQRIRDEFAAAAKRNARHGTARLMQIDANNVPEHKKRVPTLEEFATENGLEDFSQAEQLEHYLARYGSSQASQSRRRRLIARQLDALHWLEKLAVTPPRPQDPIAYWLNPDLASHLEQAGLITLEQLAQRINGIGRRWWATVPAIGEGKAQRIVDWLRSQTPVLGLEIGEHVDAPVSSFPAKRLMQIVKASSELVPLEKLFLSRELDGTEGTIRAPRERCRITAENDIQAILCWIQAKRSKAKHIEIPQQPVEAIQELNTLTNTQRSYLKEGERFLLWCVLQKKKAMSSVAEPDCIEYLAFLADPAPAEFWCGPRGRDKWSPLWRPFEGPLSESARRHAVVVLKNLFGFLCEGVYLTYNPWEIIKLPRPVVVRQATNRRLMPEHWAIIEKVLSGLADTSANQRLAFAIALIKKTGLRISQAVSARVDDLLIETIKPNDAAARTSCRLVIRPRGTQQRLVDLDTSLVQLLSEYLVSRGLPADPTHPDNRGVYLLGKASDLALRAPWLTRKIQPTDPKTGISQGTLYEQLKSFLATCAEYVERKDPRLATTFREASTEWLRRS